MKGKLVGMVYIDAKLYLIIQVSNVKQDMTIAIVEYDYICIQLTMITSISDYIFTMYN